MQFSWTNIFQNAAKEHYFIACSGGVDSMVLLYLLHRAGFSFEILHVNYQLRGEDSEGDELLVKNYGKKLGHRVHIKRFDTKGIAKNGGNLEEICRDLRFNWFEEFLSKDENNRLVLAHHLDDQVETFYLKLVRKSGLVGLTSLKAKRGKIYRPLLDFSKNEIYAFAKQHQIPWREDRTNHENDFNRNKFRNIFLPELYRQFPHLKNDVLTLIATFQQQLTDYQSKLSAFYPVRDSFRLAVREWENWTVDQQHVFLHQLQIRPTAWNEIQKLATSSIGKFCQFDGWNISKQKEEFCFEKEKESVLPELNIKVVEKLPTHFSKDVIYLEEANIKGKLSLRRWKEGDKLATLGVKGSKLVSKIINEAHLSVLKKKNTLVLTDEEKILWIVGLKIGREAIATDSSQRILKISLKKSTEE